MQAPIRDGRKLRGPGPEYLGRALAHAVLQGELPAPAADQGAVGPAECVPACVVYSGGMISVHDLFTFRKGALTTMGVGKRISIRREQRKPIE